ncbi:MAG: fibronectin type III domain-containing protein [Spirochaetales bacterium]|nr:fibronectin type III domain-containing protein [Spirochaetales bacterium]
MTIESNVGYLDTDFSFTLKGECTPSQDSAAPTVAIGGTAADPTATSPIPVTIAFSEAVTGFELSDITVTNGSPGNLQSPDNRVFTVDITPAAPGQVIVNVEAGVTTDTAGNANTAAATPYAITYSPELVAVDIFSSVVGPTNVSTIVVTIQFSEAVNGFLSGDIDVVNGTVTGFNISANPVFLVTITPTEGTVTVDVPSNVVTAVSDNLPNAAAEQFSIVVDRTGPTVAIGSTENTPTTASPIPITFTFNETVIGFEQDDMTVNNGIAEDPVSVSGYTYSVNITPDSVGTVAVGMTAGRVFDAAGNGNSAAVTYQIEWDAAPPTVVISSTESSPTKAVLIPVRFIFSEAVSGFDIADIDVVNGTESNFQLVSSTEYTIDVSPSGDSTITVDVPASSAISDATGKGNAAADQFSIVSDRTGPTVTVDSTAGSPTVLSLIPFTVTFNETITGFDSADITVLNGTAGAPAYVSGNTYAVEVTPDLIGTVSVSLGTGVLTDIAGNANTASNVYGVTWDTAAPTVEISSTESDPTSASPISITIAFSEPMSGFTIGDAAVVGGIKSNLLLISGGEYSMDITPTGDGTITVDIPASVATSTDTGKQNATAERFSIVSDRSAPTGTIIINGGDSYTKSRDVTLTFMADDGSGVGVNQMIIANEDTFDGRSWSAFSSSVAWQLTVNDELKYVYVKFSDYLGNESDPVYASITYDTEAPLPVTNLLASAGDCQVTLTWDKPSVSDFSHYEMWYGTGGVAGTQFIGTINDTGTVISDLDYHAEHTFEVFALDYAGNVSGPSTTTATPWTLPAQPTGLTVTTFAKAQLDLTWSDNADNESGYEVKRSDVSGGPYTTLNGALDPGTNSYSDTTVTEGQTYCYVVAAHNSHGSTESAELSASTLADFEVTITLVTPDSYTVDFGAWDGILNKPAGTQDVTVTLDGGAGDTYEWFVNLQAQSPPDPPDTFSLDASNLEVGTYTLAVKVTKNGIPYSGELRFEVRGE